MKSYLVKGEDLLANDPKIETDSKGNKILDNVMYVITEVNVNGNDMIVVRTQEDYLYDRKVVKTMVYTHNGFDFLINIMIKAGLTTTEKQEKTINELIDTLVMLEDFESAQQLKDEWDEYKRNKDDE